MNAAEAFVDHALGVEWRCLSPGTRDHARTFLHDTLAVAVAGAAAAYTNAVRGVVAGWQPADGNGRNRPGCGVPGQPGLRLPAGEAAFLTAFQIHAQEFDCVHEGAVLHPMTVVGAVLMAEAQRGEAVPGSELLAAAVAGVDVAVGLGLAATTPIRFFRPATAGIFGAVAALARVRRLGRDATLNAFGHALAFASGTMQAHSEGKPALPLQIANAARNALAAVDFARAGIPGPLASLDGPYGYLPMMEGGFDLARVLPSLGHGHRIDEVSCKPFPSGRATHGAVVAAQTLRREHGITAATLEHLTYRAPPLIRQLCGRAMAPGMQFAQARLCIPFAVALVLTQGTVALEDFTEERFADPALLALAGRVGVEVDDNADPAAFVPARAVARRRDGSEARVEVPVQFGSPSWALSRDQYLDKARDCLRFAGMERVHEALAAAIDGLDGCPDAALALRMTHGESE